MSIDLFSNTSNDYIYPDLTPCPNVADDQLLVWTKDGVSIIKGSQEIANIEFGDISIPITAFNKQQKILESGEVVFIQGLTKGLCYRQQGFELPSLTSQDEDLNLYFMQIDLSINYYKNFGFTYSNIDVSADYDQSIDIASALNLQFDNDSIKVSSSYDPSIIKFSGTQEGYDFEITNVYLTIIDTSQNINSPFNNGDNAQIYDLSEDPSSDIDYAKYMNTAMQGIIIRGIYPDENEEDKWFYLHHVSDYVNTYSGEEVDYNAEVSTNLNIKFDSSTFIAPQIIFDPSLEDVSIYSQTITNTLAENCLFEDCSISNSMFYDSRFIGDLIIDSSIANNSLINDDSSVNNCLLVNVFTNGYRLLVYEDPCTGNKTYEYGIDDDSLNDLLRVKIYDSSIWDSSINNTIISDCSIYNSYIKDSSLLRCTLYNSTYDSSTTLVNTKNFYLDPSLNCEYEIITDVSTFYVKERKKVEVGMSGCSTGSSLSAGDYLNWISTNNKWRKVGEIYIWTSTIDIDCSTKNLIDGFYVFNPHEFSVKIEYMTFI